MNIRHTQFTNLNAHKIKESTVFDICAKTCAVSTFKNCYAQTGAWQADKKKGVVWKSRHQIRTSDEYANWTFITSRCVHNSHYET